MSSKRFTEQHRYIIPHLFTLDEVEDPRGTNATSAYVINGVQFGNSADDPFAEDQANIQINMPSATVTNIVRATKKHPRASSIVAEIRSPKEELQEVLHLERLESEDDDDFMPAKKKTKTLLQNELTKPGPATEG